MNNNNKLIISDIIDKHLNNIYNQLAWKLHNHINNNNNNIRLQVKCREEHKFLNQNVCVAYLNHFLEA